MKKKPIKLCFKGGKGDFRSSIESLMSSAAAEGFTVGDLKTNKAGTKGTVRIDAGFLELVLAVNVDKDGDAGRVRTIRILENGEETLRIKRVTQPYDAITKMLDRIEAVVERKGSAAFTDVAAIIYRTFGKRGFEIDGSAADDFAEVLPGGSFSGGPGNDTAIVTPESGGFPYGGRESFPDVIDGGPGDRDFVSFERAERGKKSRGVDVKLAKDKAVIDGEKIGIKKFEGVGGTTGEDKLTGDGADNSFFGLDGADRISGLGGDDGIFSGNGDDRNNGNAGDDLIDSGAGKDVNRGGAGDDVINSGGGADQNFGGSGADEINSGAGADTNRGDGGDDVIRSGDGNDFNIGGSGDDLIEAGGGGDILRGFGGSDTLRGELGDDLLQGGLGDDVLLGGGGSDTLDGGPGLNTVTGDGPGQAPSADLFVLTGDMGEVVEGYDVITDFDSTMDTFSLTGDLAYEDLTIAQDNADVSISNGEDLLARVQNDTVTAIDNQDLFA
ncbi:MAG: calcium-binding protein [Pseudomonadota bacterium]